MDGHIDADLAAVTLHRVPAQTRKHTDVCMEHTGRQTDGRSHTPPTGTPVQHCVRLAHAPTNSSEARRRTIAAHSLVSIC